MEKGSIIKMALRMAVISSVEEMLLGILVGLDSFNTVKNLAYISLLVKKYKIEIQDMMAKMEKMSAITELIFIQSFRLALHRAFFKMPLYKKKAAAKI